MSTDAGRWVDREVEACSKTLHCSRKQLPGKNKVRREELLEV